MRNCEEIKVKLTNIQLNKLKSAAKKKNRNNTKNNKEKKIQPEELPDELFLTISKKPK